VQVTTEELNRVGTEMAADATGAKESMDQIASATQNLAAATETQAAAGRLTSDLLAEVQSSIREITDGIERTASHSEMVGGQALAGQNSLRKLVQQMEEIKDVSQGAIAVVQDLSARSSEIGGIVEIVNGIYSQTKLLAFNAAIEAARAGEHGREFAVVAQEIRKLAQSAFESTGTISALLQLVEGGTKQALQMNSQVCGVVANGAAIVKETETALAKIFENIKETDDQVKQILNSSGRIGSAAAEMLGAADTVGQNTEITVAGTRQIADSSLIQQAMINRVSVLSASLVEVAGRLRTLTEHFAV
jgi:methyl-accepting chemotaxis protein